MQPSKMSSLPVHVGGYLGGNFREFRPYNLGQNFALLE